MRNSMLITRDQLTSLPRADFDKLLALVDEDIEDLLYLLLYNLLTEVEVPDEIFASIV